MHRVPGLTRMIIGLNADPVTFEAGASVTFTRFRGWERAPGRNLDRPHRCWLADTACALDDTQERVRLPDAAAALREKEPSTGARAS
jgi:hypothetical protein